MTGRYCFIEYATPQQAAVAIKSRDGHPLDRSHKLRVNRLTDIEKYAEAPETYVEPETEPYASGVFSVLICILTSRNIYGVG